MRVVDQFGHGSPAGRHGVAVQVRGPHGLTLGAVTDTESKIDDELVGEPTPELIATHYLSSLDDVVEHLRAADQLDLGVRVTSYLVADEDGGGFAERWELDLLTSSPVHHEDEAE
jgi:hypothetical protein